MKKIVALVLAMVLGISMIGCSSNNSVATVNGEGIPLEYYKIYTNWTRLGYESSYGFTSSTWETEMQDQTTSSNSDSSGTSDKSKSSEKTTYWDNFKSQVLQAMEQSEVIYQKAKEVKVEPTDKEIQEQVDDFIKTHKNFQILPILPQQISKFGAWGQDLVTPQGYIRTLPFYETAKNGMDSFFICKLKRII